METIVISSVEKSFKDKETGKTRVYYQVYVKDKKGYIGFLYSDRPYKDGETIKLSFSIGRDSRLVVKAID